jgi:hypothetical protein
MDRDAHPTCDINDRLPIIPHETLGADCCGCLYVRVDGDQADIVCNECAAVIRTVPAGDVRVVAGVYSRGIQKMEIPVSLCANHPLRFLWLLRNYFAPPFLLRSFITRH